MGTSKQIFTNFRDFKSKNFQETRWYFVICNRSTVQNQKSESNDVKEVFSAFRICNRDKRLLRLALGPGNISRQIGGGSPLAWCRLVRALWTGEGRTKYCIPILHSTGLWCMVVLASCPSVHLTLVLNWNPGHEDSVLIFNPTQSYLLY